MFHVKHGVKRGAGLWMNSGLRRPERRRKGRAGTVTAQPRVTLRQ